MMGELAKLLMEVKVLICISSSSFVHLDWQALGRTCPVSKDSGLDTSAAKRDRCPLDGRARMKPMAGGLSLLKASAILSKS